MCCAPSVWETPLLGSVLALAIQRVIYIPRQNNLSGNRIQEKTKSDRNPKQNAIYRYPHQISSLPPLLPGLGSRLTTVWQRPLTRDDRASERDETTHIDATAGGNGRRENADLADVRRGGYETMRRYFTGNNRFARLIFLRRRTSSDSSPPRQDGKENKRKGCEYR